MAAGEECDDLESWEEMEDSGVLDKKIEKLKAAMSTTLQKDLRSGGGGKDDTVVFLAEDGRTRYVPPEPTVTILKRPPIMNNSHNAGGDGFIVNGDSSAKPKQPIKSLQQREMEYAEARLRILGEAQSPDERPALLERIRRIQNKTELTPESAMPEQSGVPVFNPAVIPSVIAPQPMIIMTSTSSPSVHLPSLSQTQMTANNSLAGQYSVNAYNNGCAKPVPMGNQYAISYNTPNKGGMYHQHPIGYTTAYGACNSPAVYSGGGIINTNVVSPVGNSFVTIQAPISLNLAIRQPRGPDGTKGFNNFRTTLR